MGFSLFIEPMLQGQSGQSNSALGAIGILKMFRFFRLLRAVRLVAQFRMLWQLVRGLMSSMHMILTTCILMLFILYIYACIGLELLTKEKEDYDGRAYDLIEYNFSSVFRFMLSLIQFMTFDSSAAIYTPVIIQGPHMLPYFTSFMLVVGVALMNLLTAIVVEGSFEMSRNDKDVQQAMKSEMMKKILPRLLSLFKGLDQDGSGDISYEEIQNAPPHVREEMTKLLGEDELEEIFRIIDFDGSGEIGIDEFFDNISKVVMGSLNINDMRTQKQISAATTTIREQIESLEEKLDKFMKEIKKKLK